MDGVVGRIAIEGACVNVSVIDKREGKSRWELID